MPVKVSVVVPVYNVEPYLRQCLDSLLNQTIDSKEIILVDDGSTDGSGSICDEYAQLHDCIRVIHKKNGGLGSARNCGVEVACGEYLYFIDSDDWLLPDALRALTETCTVENLDLILFAAESFHDDGSPAPEYSYPRRHDLQIVRSGSESLSIILGQSAYLTSVCLRMYRTAYFREHGFLFNETIIHEDEDIGFLSYLLAARVEILGSTYYMRRIRKGSIMTAKSFSRSADGYHFAWKRISDFARDAAPEIQQLCYTRCKIYTGICLEYYLAACPEEQKKLATICSEMCAEQRKWDSTVSIRIAAVSLGLYRVLHRVRAFLANRQVHYLSPRV